MTSSTHDTYRLKLTEGLDGGGGGGGVWKLVYGKHFGILTVKMLVF
jgi:hypothetical protein